MKNIKNQKTQVVHW